MDKQTFVYMLIEAVIFLVPVGTLFIKVGKILGRLETVEKSTDGLSEFRATTSTKVTQLELQQIAQSHTLEEINNNLIQISTKVSLLLDNKIKMESN
jgi:hypothetical protein